MLFEPNLYDVLPRDTVSLQGLHLKLFLVKGFVQTLESPGILLFRIPGLESPGKRHRYCETMEIPGKSWSSKASLLDFSFLF